MQRPADRAAAARKLEVVQNAQQDVALADGAQVSVAPRHVGA